MMFSRNDARHTMYLCAKGYTGGGGSLRVHGKRCGNESRQLSVWLTSTVVTSVFSLSKRTPSRNHDGLVSASITFAPYGHVVRLNRNIEDESLSKIEEPKNI